jgi:hypothetical protein
MQPGAVLITLDRLPLGPCRKRTNEHRLQHGLDTEERDEASFFEFEEVPFEGKGLVSWAPRDVRKTYTLYRYTRCSDSTFLCCNPACEKAIHNTPIDAWKLEKKGRVAPNRCDCNYDVKQDRKRKATEKYRPK